MTTRAKKKIPIPGTTAVLEIDEEMLAEERASTSHDFPFEDDHHGDNYGKPKLEGR